MSASKLKKTSLRKPIISWEIQLTILRDKKDSFYELPSSVLMTLSQKSNCEILLGNHNTKHKKDLDEVVFSCEDAAQQVLMSSVCLSVCVSPELKYFHIMQSLQFQNVPDCSRMHAECSRMHTGCSRMFQNACRMFQNACRMFKNARTMFKNACRMFKNACRVFKNVPKCMQIYELACTFMSLHAIT